METGELPSNSARLGRDPRRRPRVAMVLQGGGALGAYQGGVYQALHEAGLEPDWIVGISIGAINGALLAGNTPERRVPQLAAFWSEVTSRPVLAPLSPLPYAGTMGRKLFNAWSAWQTMTLGQPDFFTPRIPGPWLSPPGTAAATSFYEDAPLRATLRRLADFEHINRAALRYAAGAVDVASGDVAYFDTALQRVALDHVMAACALPPALPMVTIEGKTYWDGGVVSNTPLEYLLDVAGAEALLVFQIDLFSAAGPVPRDMFDVLARSKDIRYASRSRVAIDAYTRLFRDKIALRKLLRKVPPDRLDAAERALKAELERLPEIAIVHLTYRESAEEGEAKDYDFSAAAMHRHWSAGLRDGRAALARKEWLTLSEAATGIAVHAL